MQLRPSDLHMHVQREMQICARAACTLQYEYNACVKCNHSLADSVEGGGGGGAEEGGRRGEEGERKKKRGPEIRPLCQLFKPLFHFCFIIQPFLFPCLRSFETPTVFFFFFFYGVWGWGGGGTARVTVQVHT